MAVNQDKMRSRIATVADRETKVRVREREIEKSARDESRKYLLEARGEVERAIASVRAQAAAGEAASAEALEQAVRAARRAIEEAAAAQGQAAEIVQRQAERDAARRKMRELTANADSDHPHPTIAISTNKPKAAAALVEGDAVLVATLDGKTGRIVSVRGKDARVAVGSLTLSVPVASLTRTAAPPPPAVKISLMGDVTELDAKPEIDVRGLRVDEADDRVMVALDAAIAADLHELRIIHGKGTGALRARITEMLRKDTRVAGVRLGAWNEGGAGATVAELR